MTLGRAPSLAVSLIPVAVLIALLASSVALFGDGSSGGANQIALILAAAAGIVIGIAHGHTWKALEKGIVHGISLAMGAILILLMVGALIGSWILGGIVPTMIYYGLQLLSPSIFLPSACALCCFVSLATGSSWTTAGTVGVALIGVAAAQDVPLGLAAGAVISGAYFGDKMSPLSDTTNLAPAMAGTDLFTHIRHMAWTTGPSIIIALILFAIVGMRVAAPEDTASVNAILESLRASFAIGPHMLIPLIIVLTLVIRKMPAFPALLIGALTGCLFAVLFQQPAVLGYADTPGLPAWAALAKGAWMSLFDGYRLTSGNAALDELLSRGGMGGMLGTVWLILSAMMFGAVMETTGMLARIATSILGMVRGTGSLIAATLATAFGMNVVASDQYIAIVLPGRMFRAEYAKRGLAPKNLSRALEDAGTVTSPLVPWNTCGAFMAQTLGVATFAYAPFAFFNLINPLVSLVYGFTGFTIEKAGPEDIEEGVAPVPSGGPGLQK
ncbi:MAG TPA: Na+/H+ antiporter NhaC [Vicinamibacterales bacterium]|nr:Na+/H+ antiporter NhaC [Vicinamibacterales bacterium]